jgi:branched-chain amino acid transport system ATP-binding protein
MAEVLLKVAGLHAWYGESHILHGVGFEIGRGELVTLLGRNGAGKTTTLKSVMGIVERRTGSVKFGGRETIREPSNAIARQGIAYCPEERGIFSSLNVEENMLLPPQVKPGGMNLGEIYELFPNLKERRRSQGTKLSGGEQQMLAIGRILRTGANLLLLDEPTEGLAPIIVEELLRALGSITRSSGICSIIVEQHAQKILGLADRVVILERGTIVHDAPSSALKADPAILERYLGVSGGAAH